MHENRLFSSLGDFFATRVRVKKLGHCTKTHKSANITQTMDIHMAYNFELKHWIMNNGT